MEECQYPLLYLRTTCSVLSQIQDEPHSVLLSKTSLSKLSLPCLQINQDLSPSFKLTPPQVIDTRPPSASLHLNDLSSVEKQTMAPETYATLPNTVLSWKKNNQLGRFNPAAPTILEQKHLASVREASERHIAVDARCEVSPGGRRGTVRYLGAIEEIKGGEWGVWVGVELDEPTGRNDGSVEGKKYFECGPQYGVFVRPERVVVGDFPVEELGGDMEEI